MGGATVMAFPSRSEGFGFPTLEAMACGAAVLIARRLSLPEVGGEAAAYTESRSPSRRPRPGTWPSCCRTGIKARAVGGRARAVAAVHRWTASAQIHLDTYAQAAAATEQN